MDERPEIEKPRNWIESLNCAIEGVIYAFKTQKHIRYHYIIAVFVLALSLILKLPLVEFVLFTMAVLFLLFAEMINTAIEEAVDLIEERHNLIAKNVKDVSAGAVLIAGVGVAVMAYVVFVRHISEPMGLALREGKEFSVHIAVVALIIVLIGVVAAKAMTGSGRPLHGGMPSGHAAVAFSLWTSVALLTLDPLVTVLTFGMAAMVSQSRMLGGIHTRFEIVLGALLGCGLTLLIFRLFSTVLK
ncbi:MAG: diacylglycerol kinase [Thermodesulfobacteriota bacterium]